MSSNELLIKKLLGLPNDVLIEEYTRLHSLYSALKTTSENDLQQIHELKRNLKTAVSTETYLAQELETLVSVHSKELEDHDQKHQQLISNLKTVRTENATRIAQLETKCIDIERENVDLKTELESLKSTTHQLHALNNSSTINNESEIQNKSDQLLEEYENLVFKVNNLQRENSELACNNAYLKEQINDLENRFECKKEELDEKCILIDTLHERILELTLQINDMKADFSNKGTYIFT